MAYIGRTPTNAALTAADLADGIVSTAKIAADAVTDAKIADDVVGTEHLTANEVDTTALGADAVTGDQLADNAVNSEHYTDGSIDTAHLADGQVTTAKLATAVFTGATDIGAAIVDADLFLMDDGAGGTIRKTTASRIKTYAAGLDGVSTASGNVTITDGNLIVASGHGIDFAATADATGSGGEVLNDYEEGDWTPVINFGGSSSSVTFSSGWQGGRYTRVGNIVHATTYIILTSKGSSTGDITIGPLPYVSRNAVANTTVGSVFLYKVSFANQAMVTLARNVNHVKFQEMTESSAATTTLTNANVSDDSHLCFQITYEV